MGTWTKLLLVVLAAAGAAFGWRSLRFALASDEQKVRWLFEDVERGFNGTRMAPVIGAFETRYRDESSGLTRDELREVLTYLFLREHDPETKRFRLRLSIDAERLDIELTPGAATVAGGARFFQRRAGAEQLFWDARFVAELTEDDAGWHIARTTQVNVADLQDLD